MLVDPGLFTKLQADYVTKHGVAGVSLNDYRRIVAQDLVNLLNTKRGPHVDGEDSWKYLPGSIWSFGVCDFSGFYFGSVLDLNEVCHRVKTAIILHEPRLKEVTVDVASGAVRSVGGLGMTISAVLIAPGVSEGVQFSAFLDIVNKKYAVAAA